MRCHGCGNRVMDGQEECPTCQGALWALGPTTVDTLTPLPVAVQADPTVPEGNHGRQDICSPQPGGEMVLQQPGALVASTALAVQSALAHVIPTKRSVYGRVIIAEATYSEHPDRDVCRFITRMLWILLLVLSPVLILYWLVVNVGGLPAVLAFAGLFLLAKFISPMNLYAMFRIFSVLNPTAREPGAQVPVRYFRVREEGSDAEVMVRIKGQFTYGNIGLEDLVTLSGRSRGGTLYVQEGYNHRTASMIGLARSYSWVSLVLTLLFVLGLMVVFYEPTARVAKIINSLGGVQ